MSRTLIVGLGNYGMRRMRHSVGMMVLDCLAARLGRTWGLEAACKGFVVHATTRGGGELVLLKPRLFMNENGRSVAKTAKAYEVSPQSVFLVHDELDLKLGKCTLKQGGSARGHNGVKSTIACLQTDVMQRLRVGVGRPLDKTRVSEYVLEDFAHKEMPLAKATVESCADYLLMKFAPEVMNKQLAPLECDQKE